jgi:glycosyltransferase involved in cell wall biosynthesis
MRRADVSLAPLEPNNRFTECKSELKYFEAGLLGLPTIASAVAAYRIAITNGQNGFICNSDEDWQEALESLVEDPDLRIRMGERARQDVFERYTTRSRAQEFAQILRELKPRTGDRLSVAFVMQAPIAQTGGGYKTIFRIGQRLAALGHEVHFYVEPIAHLAGMNEAEIVDFCERHFEASSITIHAGHAVLPCDVAIATGWPTAYVVNQLSNTLCKAYFIQDFEPDFYEKHEPSHERALGSYGLPLKKITIGRYLQKLFADRERLPIHEIPFALDRSLFKNRNERPKSPVRILFFARPNIKRRAYPAGVAALKKLARVCPEVKIALYGMAGAEDLGFPYENLGELTPTEVSEQMNRSHIHLSFSLTNISWVPFEAMACGCAVVEAKVPSVRLWIDDDSQGALLVEPNPRDAAEGLIGLVRDDELRVRIAENGERLLAKLSASWEEVGARFESILLEAVFKRRKLSSVDTPVRASQRGEVVTAERSALDG